MRRRDRGCLPHARSARPPRGRGGFTLVELLISLALSVVGLLGLLALQLVSIRGNAASRSFSEATALAQERLEALQLVPYASLSLQDNQASPETHLAPNPGSTTQQLYTRTTTITVDAANNDTNIQVDVSWSDPSVALVTHHVKLYEVRTP